MMVNKVDTELPDLRIVPVDALILHERVDLRRTRPLIEQMQADGVLKNPPIVASLDNGSSFVVLDGANRTTAALELGFPHILVQVVDYSQVELDTWGHLIAGITPKDFAAKLLNLGLRLSPSRRSIARQLLDERKICGTVSMPGDDIYVLLGAGGLGMEVEILNRLVSTYEGLLIIHRVKTDRLFEVLPYYDRVAALIRFPRYTPNEIMGLATNGYRLPAGITRHVIPRRALRVNMPLSILADKCLSTEEKNQWLGDWMKHKLSERAIRFYQESTFVFDE
jgi:hypothetical protein